MRIDFLHWGREHLGIEYLSAVLKNAGHDVRLHYDPGVFSTEDNVFQIESLARHFDQSDHIIHKIVSDPPDILACSVYTSTYRWAAQMASRIRKQVKVPTIFGGYHATLAPETVAAHPAVDVAVRGECEGIICDLVQAIGTGDSWKNLSNVAFRDGEKVTVRDVALPIPNLDDLPMPDKKIFENDVDFTADYLVMTNRGCPFSCTYCCENAINRIYHGQFLRRRSVQSVMKELSEAKARYHSRTIMFNDSIFFTDKDWLLELLAQYRTQINTPFRCFGQILYLDFETVQALKDSGCYAIEFGLQTTNDHLRKEILNRRETLAEAKEAFNLCDRMGIRYDIDHILNLPEETVEDGRQAIQFYSRLKRLNRIKVHYLLYFPGTDILNFASETGLLNASDIQSIQEGVTGDFFHKFKANNPEMVPHINGLAKAMKLIPILPKFIIKRMARSDLHLAFAKLSEPLVVLFMLLVAIRGRDYRFILYIRYYWHRILRLYKLK